MTTMNYHIPQLPENPNFRFIAHRGNVTGPCEYENHPDYVREALNDGFDVEVDVWFDGLDQDGKRYSGYYLGHDKPTYKVTEAFLEDPRIWAHAKNGEAMSRMLGNAKPIHCFWHQNDDHTLTSRGYIWTYPEKSLYAKSIAVYTGKKYPWIDQLKRTCSGLCSDYLR